ncbi:hypothetical protein NC653_019062 [Populus alba x Populus x berolinensis]|uniref:Uncharacterized protein n=1 Tax=Populus alba x Populus x berolinensis TaxID=444605 RepID=A0AAD6QHW5_9ROSI|nr:hypothetical protein NC653_019062 [Populus alba x Populus x berolinensis]
MAMAVKIMDGNFGDGHMELAEVNRMALSSAFARTLSFLYQSVQNPQGSDDSSSTIGLHLEKQRPRSAGFEEADDVVAEKLLAQELLWITNKLRDYGAVDEALLQWSYASGLASLALSTANPRIKIDHYPYKAARATEKATKGITYLNNVVKNLASGNNVLNASSSAFTATGSGPFISFNDGSSTPASTNQYQGFNPFSAGSAHVFVAGTCLGAATQTMPMQFSSLASTPFALNGSTVFSSGNPTFRSSSTSNTSSLSSL